MYKNKKIFILGMARSGYAAASLLAKDNEVLVNDSSLDQDENQVKELEELGVNVILGSHPDEILTSDYDVLIKNPGIREDHKYVLYAYKHNIKVINEVELAYHYLPKNVTIIGITGSNGKTTTVSLIYEVLKRGKRKVHLLGNIGTPLSGAINNINENDIIILEISDQQLFNFYDFKTDISILTNLSETHLDLHNGSYKDYMNNKKKIFNHHDKEDIAIINMSDSDSMNITEDIKSTKIYFSRDKKCDGAYFDGNNIYYHNDIIMNVKDIRLKGIHNYENIMCAIIVGMLLCIDKYQMIDAISDFAGVEHRLEFVRKINNITFYNDSKSTNNKSTTIALSSFDNPTILLLGGLDRGMEFDELLPYMNNVTNVICYGETKHKINNLCNNNNIKCSVVNNLEEATKLAYNLACEDTVVLLSPACASWDQYKKFEDRGDEFKRVVNEL